MLPREVEKNTDISHTSIRQMIKRRELKQFKSLKATMMISDTQERRTKRHATLADRFGKCLWRKRLHYCIVPIRFKISCKKNWSKSLLSTQNDSHHSQILVFFTEPLNPLLEQKGKKCMKTDSIHLLERNC